MMRIPNTNWPLRTGELSLGLNRITEKEIKNRKIFYRGSIIKMKLSASHLRQKYDIGPEMVKRLIMREEELFERSFTQELVLELTDLYAVA